MPHRTGRPLWWTSRRCLRRQACSNGRHGTPLHRQIHLPSPGLAGQLQLCRRQHARPSQWKAVDRSRQRAISSESAFPKPIIDRFRALLPHKLLFSKVGPPSRLAEYPNPRVLSDETCMLDAKTPPHRRRWVSARAIAMPRLGDIAWANQPYYALKKASMSGLRTSGCVESMPCGSPS
jgi:hypothetical protein